VSPRLTLRVPLAVGLVAGCTLALQVLLTRIFSAVLFYHFAFFAISLALLGVGAGAILIYLWPERFPRAGGDAVMARWCAGLAALLLVVPAVLVRLDYSFPALEVTAGFVGRLAVGAVFAALPFLVAGIVIALAIRNHIESVGRVYGFDLAGAGVGALAVVPLLWVVDAPTLSVALGVVAGLAALLFAGRAPRERLAAGAVTVAAVVLTALSAATSLYELPAQFTPERTVVADRWTPISRVIGYEPDGPAAPAIVTYDQDVAPVPFHRRGGPMPDWRELGLGPQSVGYALTGPGHALVIGGGGGRDIYNALSSGQRRVDVIELNREIRAMVDEDLRRWSGAPYSLPQVSSTAGDGRSTLAARARRYDQIHIGFTNTLTASAGQAYALSENNLYTVEAFDEYLDHLRPDGILSVSRLYRFAGDETLRATVLALRTLERRGVEDPERHVAVLLGRDELDAFFGTVLVKREPYSDSELVRLRELADERTRGIAFAPGGPYRREWRELAAATDLDSFCRGYRVNVCAPTDDQPFFLNSTRLRDLAEPPPEGSTFIARTPFVVLLATLGILAVLCLLAFVLPLALQRRAARPPVSSLVFFAAIGLGFLLLEITLIQRFVLYLGFPTYALSVVLFSLLVFTGVGALLSARFAEPRRALTVSLGIACGLIGAGALGLQPLLRETIDLPFAARIAVTVALLAPVGVTLGMAMPIGLRRLSALHPSGVPWAWGINGITSVLASALAIAIAILAGFTVTTLVALACYLGALAHVRLGRWPEPPPAPRPEPSPAAVTTTAAAAG
jgi:hypothetical protein